MNEAPSQLPPTIEDAAPPRPGPETATGGCALGCGSLFLVAGAAFVLLVVFSRTYQPENLMVLLYIGGPAFLLGHHLAIIAILSKSDAARTKGKRALLLMWISVAVLIGVYLLLHVPKSPVAN